MLANAGFASALQQLRTGKKPATHDPRDWQYAAFRGALKNKSLLPKVRIPSGHGNDFGSGPPPRGWGMFANGPDPEVREGWSSARENGAGDCFWAGSCREHMAFCFDRARAVPHFTADIALESYSAYGKANFGNGYNPVTGEFDEGTEPRTGYKWRQLVGVPDVNGIRYHVKMYIAVEPGNWEHLTEVIYLFGQAGVGVELPESAEYQFNEGRPLTVVAGAAIAGGHYFTAEGNPRENVAAGAMWERRFEFTRTWFEKYNDECWIVVPGAPGEEYLDQEQAEEYITQLAESKAP